MPRFHFHSADGGRDLDQSGVDLPDEDAARLEAVRYAGEVLRHQAPDVWSKGHWRVETTDDQGVLLFTIIALAIDAPRPAAVRADG